MSWQFNSNKPIYAQIMEQVQILIVTGVYKTGEKLPSVRDLASEAAVNPNTMQKALTELEREGLVFSQRTSGRFITQDGDMLLKMKETMAKEQINQLLEQMYKIGYEPKESLELMREIIKEME